MGGFLEDGEGRGCAELGHVVIADDHVPGGSRQGGSHVIRVLNTLGINFVPGLLQVAAYECRVAFGIVDLQDPEFAHGVVSGASLADPAPGRGGSEALTGGGGSFMLSE